MATYIKALPYNRPAQDPQVKEFFGLDRKAKWPNAGMAERVIQGVTCWVEPATPGPFRLRAMCHCPECGFITAIGRLAQHAKVHK